jgi:N4-gp56 family major capsid protein
MGTEDTSVIQVKKDLMKKAGDNIVFHLRALLTGAPTGTGNICGQGDDGTLEGNEEAQVFHDTSLTVHERGHATKVNGIMTEQRTSIPLRETGKTALGEWIGRILDADLVAALSGVNNTKTFAGQMTGAQAIDSSNSGILTVNTSGTSAYKQYGYLTYPSAGKRIFYGGQNSAGKFKLLSGDSTFTALSSDEERFGTRVIKFVKKMATATVQTSGTIINPIRPITDPEFGDKLYLMLISPEQAYDLKKETAWNEAQKHANIRGRKNPLFDGALGIYDGVVIKECPLIHMRYGIGGTAATEFFMSTDDVVTSSCYVARALFLGAQAGLMGMAQLPTWKEKMFDYGAKFGISTRMIYGTLRPIFNSVDFGCIAVDTQVDPDSA